MQLVSDINKAVPFGLESSAQKNANELAELIAPINAQPLTQMTGEAKLDVVPLPEDTPYGPWWVIRVTCGAEVRYIAN